MITIAFNKLVDLLTSLKLTVYCLVLSLGLLLAGTLAQVNHGIYKVQDIYFQSFFIYWPLPYSSFSIPVLPGGYLLGLILALNLTLHFFKTFKFAMRKLGIYFIHAGILMLGIGQVLSDVATVESRMVIDEGQAVNYSTSWRKSELAIITPTSKELDTVVAIPEKLLRKRPVIKHQNMPFHIELIKWMPNSKVVAHHTTSLSEKEHLQGLAQHVSAVGIPETGKVDEVNIPSAYIRITHESKILGAWLISNHISEKQSIQINGQTYTFQLRPTRYYKPYSIHLNTFTHDRYAGTDIPKNFASEIQVIDPEKNVNRTTTISMNRPLRYEGDVFYQASYMNNDTTSILQVVHNAAAPVLYISCALITLGMIVQFMYQLVNYLRRRMRTA